MKKDPIHEARKVSEAVQMQEVAHLNQHFEVNANKLNSGLDLKDLYPIVRPLLTWIEGFFGFKPEWQSAIGILINTLDAEYPAAVPKPKANTGDKVPGLED